MTRAHLVACPSCARHVRVSETDCVFCGSPLPIEVRATPAPPRFVRGRLSRAALVALGTTSVALAAACGGRAIVEGSPGSSSDGSSSSSGQSATPDQTSDEDYTPTHTTSTSSYGGPPPEGWGKPAPDAGKSPSDSGTDGNTTDADVADGS